MTTGGETREERQQSFAAMGGLSKTGEPGSSSTLKNPDGSLKQKRWYDDDGNAARDRDFNHPGNMKFPHDHEWKDGERQEGHLPPDPSYEISLETAVGAGLIVFCAAGICLIVIDDTTGLGVVDNFMIGPMASGISTGTIMVFG